MSERRVFYAHSDAEDPRRLPEEEGARWQRLADHLMGVAGKAEAFAEGALPGDESFRMSARLAAILHDLGKYSDGFQAMLRDVTSGKPKSRVVHSAQGAAFASSGERGPAIEVALAVLGHHAGIPEATSLGRVRREYLESLPELLSRCSTDGIQALDPLLEAARTPGKPSDPSAGRRIDLRTRMLASCLLDADRLDSSEHMGQSTTSSPELDAERLLGRLLAHLEGLRAGVPTTPVNRVRQEILHACLHASSWEERLQRLTVPTGGGKTLASLAFALKRAVLRPGEVRRIIVVIPYLSIIEQNAQIYRQVLGDEHVLEHHSGNIVGLELQGSQLLRTGQCDDYPEIGLRTQRNAEENWDAPVIVTTAVRFFESLFSNHPSDLRRLHRIARSLVILDEVQTLPRELLRAVLSMIRGLADEWHTTFLFCTATQPAVEDSSSDSQFEPRWPRGTLREIIQDPHDLARRLSRVTVQWPAMRSPGCPEPTPWLSVASKMLEAGRALCVVNTRSHALHLFRVLRQCAGDMIEGLFHLSNRMCPRHRLDVIAAVDRQLHQPDQPCLVVSTQLIEAGVDLDFPLVLRALAPLDSVAQAAGRCDREGRLTLQQGRPAGQVIVFEPEEQSMPAGDYLRGKRILETMLSEGRVSIENPYDIQRYFDRLYEADLDARDIEALRQQLDFPEVAQRFRLIDRLTQGVIVPYGMKGRRLASQVAEECRLGGLEYREMQHYSVGLYPREFAQALASGAISQPQRENGVWIADTAYYHHETGLVLEHIERNWLV